jgi:NADPH-dependent 2,4-dienoyl-CoA reductase/sulfur reductase-like enzyme
LVARKPETFREKQNIDVRTRHEVIGIDPDARKVQVRDLERKKDFWESYDRLMIATGAKPIRPPLEGIDAAGILDVNTLHNGIAFKRMVEERQPEKAVVAGGGYIGLEMAEALKMRGMDVVMVSKARQVMGTLDSDMGELVARALMEDGIDLYRDETVQSFAVENGHLKGVVTDQRTLPADIVVLGLGVGPNSDLAKDAGIPVGVQNGIKVNELQQTETDGVWSAGDCVQTHHIVSRRPFYVALGTVANKQGRVAGINLGGGYATFPGAVGTAITKYMDTECSRTGLSEREIEALGWQYAVGKIDAATLPHYYPGSAPITVKVLAEKGSGKLLGAQIVGGKGSAKRIDVAAAALHAGFTLDEMLYLDLSYAPPFAGVWDPMVIAARKALEGV